MISNVFNIENFNIISDDNNYYFFRALNNRDNNDISNGITTDTNGNIMKVRTDRQTYKGDTKYSENDTLTLEEIFDHIKMQHRTDTNCISLTTNANVAILYGREYYKDKYIMVKVPKDDLGKIVVNAGQYMIDETNKRINELLQTNELSDEIKFYIQAIDLTTTKQELSKLIKDITKEELILTDNMFKKGIDYNKNITTTVDYQALTKEQNLEKDKIVAKLNIIGKNILSRTSNRFLIQTIGTAFSSLELIHYNEITKEELIEIPKEITDIFALLQQMPISNQKVEQLKRELLTKTITKDYHIKEFRYHNYYLNTEEDYTIDKMYELTKGDVDYYQAINLYKKSFYLSKSKLRTNDMINLLNQIIEYNPEYQDIIEELKTKTYGVEYKIFSKTNSNKLQVSQSVNLDFSKKEKELFKYVNNLTISDLNRIINKPLEALSFYLRNFQSIEHRYMSKEDYYANAIIDLFDWTKFNIAKIYPDQRQEIIKKLKEKHIIKLYDFLKLNNVKESEIAESLLTIAIKNKELKTVDLDDTFTLEQLESFLGYYQIKETEDLNLRDYQVQALRDIDASFQKHNYTSVILPTGAGKSFVALAEMLEHKDKKILYLAPNNEILSQLSRYTKKYITGPSGTSGLSNNQVLKRKFKNITTATYSKLTEETAKDIIKEKYDLIIFDELHRTGAEEWNKYVKEQIDNQTKDIKVLGITATPQRDMDLSNMSDYWAKRFGYTEEEISKQKHISTNMDLEEGIRAGYVVNPKLVTCEYSLLKDGKLENLQEKIDNIPDEPKKQELKLEYEKLRRNVEKSNGIEQILEEHLKKEGRYIVFLPITKKDNETYEDEDGNQVSNSKAERIIQAYQTQMRQYVYMGNYLKEHATILDEINTKLQNNEELSHELIHYLYKEQKNILLLSRINNITKTNNILVTHTNDIADNIIKYMDWKPLSFGEQGKLLREKTNDLVDCYSMLGSYTDTKNTTELSNFSSTESNKLKFMFVMNKLNEGVHLDDVDGIIWLRAMDENSKILYLQQLGRCIFGLDPNKPLPEEKRPLVIDLVNNTLTVKLKKGEIPEINDLNLLKIIENYINSNQKLELDINSKDEIESYYAKNLKRIQEKYIKYLDNSNLLNDLEYQKQRSIEEIISIGSNMDLWNKDFNITKVPEPKNNIESAFSLYEGFQLTGIMKDFYDLTEKVKDNLNLSNDQLTELYIEYLYLEDETIGKRKGYIRRDDKTPIGNTTMGIYLSTEQQIIKNILEKERLTAVEQNRLDNYNKITTIKDNFEIEEQNQLTELYIEYLCLEDEPTGKRKGYINQNDKMAIRNTTMYNYFHNEQYFIQKLLEKKRLTAVEQNRLDNYNKILTIKDNLKIEEQNELTKTYIEYLCLEDEKIGKRKGYINQNDKTPLGNTMMGSYFYQEQKRIQQLLEKEHLTPNDQNRIDNYNKIKTIKNTFEIEKQNQLTELYIDYLYLENKKTGKRKGYINQSDKTPLGNTMMGGYFNQEQDRIKQLLKKEHLTAVEQNRIDNYNKILTIKDNLKIEEQNQLTELYIEYLCIEDETTRKRKGYISRNDKTPLGNATMCRYFDDEQQFIQKLLEKKHLTVVEQNRLDNYNKILTIKDNIKIEEQNELTKTYIEYLCLEDEKIGKRKGYINQNDKTPLGNTLMGIYFGNEQQFIQKLLKKEHLTLIEQNRLDNYNKILKIQENFKIEEQNELTELYIDYLCLEDEETRKNRGYIRQDDITPLGNTKMGKYLCTEQRFIKKILKKEYLTSSEQNRLDNYNKILKIKEELAIEEQTKITKIYIDYLYLEDKNSGKRRGYISKNDKTPIGGTTMGLYLSIEQKAVKRLLEKKRLIPSKQNRLDNYNKILKMKKKLQNISKAEYELAKTDLDEVSKFNEVRNQLNNKEKDDGRTIH